MKRVLLLATTTGYQIRSFGEAAEKLGVRLVFASDRCDQLDDPWWDQAIPVRFHDEARSVEAVESSRRCAGCAAVDGILAVGDRPTSWRRAWPQALGLPGNPPEAARASRNKLASRAALQRRGLPTPRFTPCRSTTTRSALAASRRYPAVVKPLALSGSRGVMRVDDAGGVRRGVRAAARASCGRADVRLERDAAHEQVARRVVHPGREFAVEGVLTDGVLRSLAIFDKPDPLDGPFFEETIYVTPSRAPRDVQQRDRRRGRARRRGARPAPRAGSRGVPRQGETTSAGLRARSRGAADRRAVLAGAAASALRRARRRRSRRCCCATRSARTSRRYVREPTASGVMMIPIPRRGIYRGVRRRRGGARGRRRRGRAHHREAGRAARAAAGGQQLSGIHLRARRDACRRGAGAARCARAAAVRDRAGDSGRGRERRSAELSPVAVTTSPAAARSRAAAPRPRRRRSPPCASRSAPAPPSARASGGTR